jgi:glucosamine--fructose-6-phosphate aminotransferase (isomerizing)
MMKSCEFDVSLKSKKIYRNSRMYREIFQIPQSIVRTIESLNESVNVASNIIEGSKLIFLTGSGTSYNASLIGEIAFVNNGRAAIAIRSSELSHFLPKEQMKAAVILLSQSGESREIRNAINTAKKRGYATIGIANESKSFLATECDVALVTRAGKEISLAATKTFIAEVVALYALVFGSLGDEYLRAEIQRIKEVTEQIKALLNKSDQISELASRISGNVVFLGNGYLHAVAMEGALKIGETTGTSPHAYPIGEYLHGPLQSLSMNDTVIILEGNDEREVRRIRSRIRRYCENLIIFGSRNGDDIILPESRYPELAALIYSVSLQLLANSRAIYLGLDPDHPDRLEKIVR